MTSIYAESATVEMREFHLLSSVPATNASCGIVVVQGERQFMVYPEETSMDSSVTDTPAVNKGVETE